VQAAYHPESRKTPRVFGQYAYKWGATRSRSWHRAGFTESWRGGIRRSQLPLLGVSVSHGEASSQLSSCRQAENIYLVSASVSQIEGPQTPKTSNTPRVAKSRAARVILSREMASCRLIAKTSRFQIDLAEAYCRSVFFSCSHKADIVRLRHVISHTRLQGTRTGPCLCYFRLILQPILMRRSGTSQILDAGVMQDDNLVFYQIK
jgi:hypothetical protein